MHKQQVGAGLGESLHDLDKVGAVRGLAAGEINPLQEGIRGGEGADFVEGQLVVESAGRVLDLPDVAVNACGIASASKGDEDQLGGRTFDAGSSSSL